jgi:acyl-CoA synthetase (AMP-forming)/AMP-acid ligase II
MEYTYDLTMFKTTFEREFTFLNGFMRNVRRFAGRPALTCPQREARWTYAELNKSVNRLAHALIADGVGKHAVVMQQLLNCAEFVFCYLAPHKIGAISSPVNFRLSPGETALIIDDSEPAVFFYDAEVREIAVKAWPWPGTSRAGSSWWTSGTRSPRRRGTRPSGSTCRAGPRRTRTWRRPASPTTK